ncbi:MAG: squalene/phytoene synthase family protein, partial [Verrucomicrobia bacterium]|nr:squalene/phytoene synthase family protein [Verrucomicrobiota bacterium]
MSLPATNAQTAPPLPLHPDKVGPAADFSGQSNLALSFLCLSAEKRADMNVFYTFCRVVDDIADSPEIPAEEKQSLLDAWKNALTNHALTAAPVSSGLLPQVRALIDKYRLPVAHFLEIIAGCGMDLQPQLYADFDALRAYCYRVASVVGLVSIEIFGYNAGHAEACRRYAVELGQALQLTNIIRDVAKDLSNGGRIYLPVRDLGRFGISVEDLRALAGAKSVRTQGAREDMTLRLRRLLEFEADRAETHYRAAVAALPAAERRHMVAAEIMRAVYHRLLRQMRHDQFQVMEKNYRLSKGQKLRTVAAAALSARFYRRNSPATAA